MWSGSALRASSIVRLFAVLCVGVPILQTAPTVVLRDGESWVGGAEGWRVTQAEQEGCFSCPVRILGYKETIHSGVLMNVSFPASAFAYTYAFHFALMIGHSQPRNTLFLGGGGCIVPSEMRYYYPFLEKIDVVEISLPVLALASKYFFFVEDAVLESHHSDATKFLHQNLMIPQYDFIAVDLFDPNAVFMAEHRTVEFYEAIAARLSDGGMVAVNTITSLYPWWHNRDQFHQLCEAMTQVFTHVAVLPVWDSLEPWETQAGFFPKTLLFDSRQVSNIVLLASKGGWSIRYHEAVRRAYHWPVQGLEKFLQYMKNPHWSPLAQEEDLYYDPNLVSGWAMSDVVLA